MIFLSFEIDWSFVYIQKNVDSSTLSCGRPFFEFIYRLFFLSSVIKNRRLLSSTVITLLTYNLIVCLTFALCNLANIKLWVTANSSTKATSVVYLLLKLFSIISDKFGIWIVRDFAGLSRSAWWLFFYLPLVRVN